MGAPNYGARVPESIELTTAGATKLFDIFVQAAPEIIAAFPTEAKKAGAAVQLFDADGKFTSDGIAFLQGAPATQAQLDLCNNILGVGVDAGHRSDLGGGDAAGSGAHLRITRSEGDTPWQRDVDTLISRTTRAGTSSSGRSASALRSACAPGRCSKSRRAWSGRR